MSSIVAVHQPCSSISDSQSSTEKGLESSKLELAYRSAGLCWKVSHPPPVHVWATASNLYNNFFFEHIFAEEGRVRIHTVTWTEDDWIQRQVEINWRFKHIYSIVGCNPHRRTECINRDPHIQLDKLSPCRFIFVDNPDLESVEPRVEERRRSSRDSLYKLFCLLDAMVMRLQADLDWNEMMQLS